MRMPLRNTSLMLKSSLILSVLLILLCSVFMIRSYNRDQSLYYSELETIETMLDAQMEASAPQITNSKQQLSALNAEQFMADGNNKALQKQLEYMLNSGFIANSYLFLPDLIKRDSKNYLKMLHANKALIDSGLGPGTDYEMPETFMKAYVNILKGGSGITDVYSDSGGTWISVLSPVKDEKGDLIAVFGIDFNYSRVQSDMNQAVIDSIWAGLLFGIPCILIVVFLIWITLKPLRQLTQLSLTAAQGDLSVSIPVRNGDEVGKLSANFNMMIGSIRQLVSNIKSSADEVSNSSFNLMASSDQTSKATHIVAESIEEVAAGSESQMQSAEESRRAMEEIAIGIQRIAESSATVSELAADTANHAEQGSTVIQRTIEQMNSIYAAVNDSASVIRDLGERSKEIGHIVSVIHEIARQTDLLALNAAIEAARAGEHGKGFAVVAQEVRKLAERAKDSSDQIGVLLQGIGSNAQRAVDAMEHGAQEVEAGTEVANLAGQTFSAIVGSIRTVTDQVQEVSAASEQMSAGTEQVTASLEELARIAREASGNSQNVAASSEEQLASMEEIARAAAQLRDTSKLLQAEINKFTW